MTTQPAPELEDELAAFRREWQEETRRRQPHRADGQAPPRASEPESSSTSTRLARVQPATTAIGATSPRSTKRRSLDPVDTVQQQLERTRLSDAQADERVDPAPPRPQSALDLYSEAVRSEQEGRLNDALVNYRSAFRLDPDVDKVWNRATTAAQARALRPGGASSHAGASSASATDFRFARTVQLGPDYEPSREHRTEQAAHDETGGKIDTGSTHPSSTSFLLHSLLKSFAEHPYERDPRPLVQASPDAAAPDLAPAAAAAGPEAGGGSTRTPEQALADLGFLAADEEKPLPLAALPHEVLLLILRHLVLSPMLAPPKSREGHADDASAFRSKRLPKKRTLKEEMLYLEDALELEHTEREWKSDVESLERFARTCRAARIVTLDSALWR
ncbi:hypothetical protein JCM11491_006063 [Sporobolomyces phaffii]